MEIIIDIEDSVPLFGQLIEQIKKAVLSDKISPGDALPSIRQLGETTFLELEQQNGSEGLQSTSITTTVGPQFGQFLAGNRFADQARPPSCQARGHGRHEEVLKATFLANRRCKY